VCLRSSGTQINVKVVPVFRAVITTVNEFGVAFLLAYDTVYLYVWI
jgi:hypothetical protein